MTPEYSTGELPAGIMRNQSEAERDINSDGFLNIFDKSDVDADLHQGKTVINAKNREIIKNCKSIEEMKNLSMFCFNCWRISKKIDSSKFASDPKDCLKDFSSMKFVDFRKNSEKAVIDGMKRTVASGVDLKFRCYICRAMNIFAFEIAEIDFKI